MVKRVNNRKKIKIKKKKNKKKKKKKKKKKRPLNDLSKWNQSSLNSYEYKLS